MLENYIYTDIILSVLQEENNEAIFKNIGKIETASVEINGITVIAGENNTGKSTVGRALFAVFNSFYNIQKQIESERVQNIENLIDMMYRNVTNRYTRRFDSGEIAQKLLRKFIYIRTIPRLLKI